MTFTQPTCEEVTIFIGSEMPHLAEEIDNVFEWSDSIASNYLKADGFQTIVQSHFVSNVVKHKISRIRQQNFKLTGSDIQQLVARKSATRSSTFIVMNKTNTKGGNNNLFVW